MPSSKPSRRRLGREALRAWYAPRRDAYPWRGSHDPYAVWVSEVMLQQTQASRVVPGVRVVPAPLPDRPSARRRPPWRRRRGSGVASATTVAPCGSRRRRASSSATTAAASRATRSHCASSPASVRTRPRRWLRWGSASRSRSSTPTCGGSSRGCISGIDGHEVSVEGSVGARRGVAGPRRPRHVEPGADGSRPGGVSTRTPMRRLPARRRLPVPPRWSGREPRAESAGTVRGVDPTGAGRGRRRAAVTPVVDARAARLGDRVPGRSRRCGGGNAFGRRARRGRCRACPARVVISSSTIDGARSPISRP